MVNPYKRLDVFQCSQEAHARFDGRVSVYHVLKEKQCYPQGCLYFHWHCILMEKGKRCIHKYQYVGKNCKGCSYFVAEKVHLQPELMLEPDAYQDFLEELEDFEAWLKDIRFRRLNVAGRVKFIKPWFEQVVLPAETHTKLRGYLLVFRRGFIGRKEFEDTFFVRISERMMRTYRFVPKMKIEMYGEIREDRGRIIVHRPQRIEILKPGWGRPLTWDRALVAIKTATLLPEQPDHCLACRWGALIDVVDREEFEEKRYRKLYCLKGISEPEGCYISGLSQSHRNHRHTRKA